MSDDILSRVNTDDLPKLTTKQTNYVAARLEGQGPSEAYLTAYDADPNGKHIRQTAHQIEHKPKIQEWITKLDQRISRAVCTKEAHLQRLDQLGEKAEDEGDLRTAVTAEVNRGKAVGHYNHVRRQVTATTTLADLLKEIDGKDRGLPQIDGELVKNELISG